MTIFENYSDKDESIIKVDEPVTIKNIENFMAGYDPNVVQGYLIALQDIFTEIENIVFKAPSVPTPAGTLQRKMLEFYTEKNHLLNQFIYSGIRLPEPSNTSKP